MVHPRRPGPRNNAARLFGYDLFISFALGPAPRATQSYASDLARRLRERDLTVFFSEDEAPPGEYLDRTLRRALYRSKVLVVIANKGTLESPRWVRVEVEEFRKHAPNRSIIPINIGGALQDPELSDGAQVWLQFRDKIWLDETEEAAISGIASDALIDRLATAPTRARSNVRWRWVVRGVVAGLALLAAGLGATAWIAVNQRDEARANQLLVQARTMPESHRDVALLLGAEASRLYPERMDGQIELLARLTQNTAIKSLLRVDGWVRDTAVRANAIAFGTAQGELIVVDATSWTQVNRWRAHAGAIQSVWIDASGTRLASFDGEEITVWEIATGRALAKSTFKGPSGNIAFSPNGATLALEQNDGVTLVQIGGSPSDTTAKIEQVPTGRSLRCLAFDSSGTRLVYADKSSTEVWNIAERRVLSRYEHAEPAAILARSEDCSTIAVARKKSGGKPGSGDVVAIDVQSAVDGALLGSIQLESAPPRLFFRNEGRNLVALNRSALPGEQPQAEVWSIRPWRYLGSVSYDAPNLRKVETSRDGRWLAISTLGPTDRSASSPGNFVGNPWVDVFDLKGEEHWMRIEFQSLADHLIFSADSSALLTWSSRLTGFAQPVWSLRPAKQQQLTKPDEWGWPWFPEFRLNRDGTALLITGGGVSIVSSPASVDPTRPRVDLPEAADSVAQFSPDGSLVAIAVKPGAISIVDASRPETTLHRVSVPHSDASKVTRLAMSPDNRRLAIGKADGEILLYSLDASGQPTRLTGPGQMITGLVFSADGRRLASGDESGSLRVQVLDGAAGARLLRKGSGSRVNGLAFNSNSSLLAATFPVGQFTLVLDVRTAEEVARLEPDSPGLRSLAFIGDDRFLVSGSLTGSRSVWDIERQRLVARLGGTATSSGGGPRLVGGSATAERVAGVELARNGRTAALLYAENVTSRSYAIAYRDWSSTALTSDACSISRRNFSCAEWAQYFPSQPYHRTCAEAPAQRCDPRS